MRRQRLGQDVPESLHALFEFVGIAVLETHAVPGVRVGDDPVVAVRKVFDDGGPDRCVLEVERVIQNQGHQADDGARDLAPPDRVWAGELLPPGAVLLGDITHVLHDLPRHDRGTQCLEGAELLSARGVEVVHRQ